DGGDPSGEFPRDRRRPSGRNERGTAESSGQRSNSALGPVAYRIRARVEGHVRDATFRCAGDRGHKRTHNHMDTARSETSSVADLAAGAADEPLLGDGGRPAGPVLVVDLDEIPAAGLEQA